MPTIDRSGPFRVYFYANDHEPAHVHIEHPDGVIVINLRRVDGGIELELREVLGDLGRATIRQAWSLAEANKETYLQRWEAFHGTTDR